MSDIEQEQIRSSRFYDDTLAAGASLETPSGLLLSEDLDALRSQINRVIQGAGSGNWFDPILNNFGLTEISNKKLFYRDPFDPAIQQFVLGAGAQGVVIDSAEVSRTPKTLAIGVNSTTVGGVAAALEPNFTVAGTLGVGLTQLIDVAGIVINQINIIDDATNEAPTDNDDIVFGLVQAINGTGDGTAIAGDGSENLQITFAKIDAGTNALALVTLPAGTYNFDLVRCTNFFNASPGVLLAGSGALPDVISPDSQAVRLPWREYQITNPGPGPVAILPNDPVNVTNGIFTTAGAQTNTASFGTPALPANAIDFRDDSRIKIWRNGQLQSKQNQVNWVSATQFSFARRLFINERISWEMPSSY